MKFIKIAFTVAPVEDNRIAERKEHLATEFAAQCLRHHRGKDSCTAGALPCPFLLDSDLASCEYVEPADWLKVLRVCDA